jgi:hypothetical protein
MTPVVRPPDLYGPGYESSASTYKQAKEQSYMRIFKLIGALVVALAFSAVAVSTASAAETLWRWLPGTVGETFEGKTGEVTLQMKGGGTIKCQKSLVLLSNAEAKVNSELIKEGSTEGKWATLALALIDFESCTTAGLSINSLGDKPGIVLAHVEIHNCLIKKEHHGLLIKPLPLHIEVPAVKELLEVTGNFIALIQPLISEPRHFELNITQKEGIQGIEKCEGGNAETLLVSVNEGAFVQSGEEAKEGLLLFDKEGQEMMEN